MFIEQDDEEKKNGSSTPSIGSGGVETADDIGSVTGGSSTSDPQSADKQPAKNQNFASVQDYLKANTTQGNELGDKFVGKLQDTLGNEKSAIDSSANAFKTDVEGATVKADPNLVSSAVNTPTKVANDPSQLTNWLSQYNASYAGPTSFENSTGYAPAAKAATDANQKSQLVKDTGGREQLLQDEFNDYGQGNRGLDQALLQNSGRGGDIQAFAPQFASVGDYLKSASLAGAGEVDAAKATTGATKDAAHKAIDDRMAQFQTDLNGRVDAARQQGGSIATKYQNDFASNDPAAIETDLRASGVDEGKIASIVAYLKQINDGYGNYGGPTNLKPFYNFNPSTDINPANVATSDDYANAGAYNKLTGQDFGGILNPADADKAGTWDTARAGINTDALAKYLTDEDEARKKAALTDQTQPSINFPDRTVQVPTVGGGTTTITIPGGKRPVGYGAL